MVVQPGLCRTRSETPKTGFLRTRLICKSKKKLFYAFIDLKQAFDKIWRGGLWQKMFSYNIKGKCLNVIRNMYRNIKSCVQVNGNNSSFFTSNIGVRQGENLSPFLFDLFLNDLYDFFQKEKCERCLLYKS